MASGPSTNGNGQIQKRREESPLIAMLNNDAMKREIARALPKHLTPERMARVALTALRTVKDLAQCTPASFAASIMTLSQIGLEPSTPLGHAYLIPRRIKGTLECTTIIGYQGMLELARRSGQVRAIWAYPVYKGDDFVVKYGLSPTIEHAPRFDAETPRNEKTLTHVYAAARLKDSDDPIFVVLTKREVEGYRQRGQGAGPWQTDYEAMALKTAVRRLYRWLPKSIEVAQALRVDEAPEIGRSQLDVVSAEVREAVERQGLELPPEVPSDVPIDAQPIDEVGEVREPEPEPAARGRGRAQSKADPASGEVSPEDEPSLGEPD
jgi:recombination protein RecT